MSERVESPYWLAVCKDGKGKWRWFRRRGAQLRNVSPANFDEADEAIASAKEAHPEIEDVRITASWDEEP